MVVIEARSDPMAGSVIATAVMSSPEQMPGIHRAICSSLQSVRKYGRQMSLWSVHPSPAALTPARWISSAITTL